MHQAITLSVLIVLSLILLSPAAATAASDGNWGRGVGLLAGPILFSYLATALVYYPTRILSGAGKVAGFAKTRLHYVGLVVGLLAVFGQVGRMVAQSGSA
jgi:hypothetical protein